MASIKLNNQLRHALRRVMFTGRSYTVEPPATIERDTLSEFQADDDGTVTYAVMPDPTQTGAVPWPDSKLAKQFTLEWHFSPTAKPTFTSSAVDRALRLKLRERRNGVTYHLSTRRERRDPPHPPHRGQLLRLPPLVGSVAVAGAVIAATALGYVGIVQGKLLGNLHVGGPHRPSVIVTPTFTTTPLVPSTITITAPADNSNLLSTAPTTFSAVAADIHGNPLPDSAFTWKDDVDGALGASGSIQHAPTVKGGGACTITKHHVTASALDPLEPGTPLVAAITVNAYTGAACKLAITAPANNTTNTGQSVTFAASATNALGSAVPDSAISWNDDVDGGLGSGHSVTHTPSVPGDPCIVTKHHVTVSAGKLTATVTVSAYTGAACKLTISAPGIASNVLDNASVTLKAVATDALGNGLPGSGINWNDDVDGALGTGGSLPYTPSYNGGTNCATTKHHVSASDGGKSATIALTVYSGRACQITIVGPANNSIILSTTLTTVTAKATDAVGNNFPCSQMTWTDSVDGSLGTGCALTHHFSATACGPETVHQITVSANSGDAQIQASVTVSAYTGVVCSISITAPANNSTFITGTSISFSGSATNDGGYALPSSALSWSDSVDGYMGTGIQVSFSLSGSSSNCDPTIVTHYVTATATDPYGDVKQTTITVNVQAPCIIF